MAVWTWSGLEACLFWSWIDVIVVRLKVSRGIVSFSPWGCGTVRTPANRPWTDPNYFQKTQPGSSTSVKRLTVTWPETRLARAAGCDALWRGRRCSRTRGRWWARTSTGTCKPAAPFCACSGSTCTQRGYKNWFWPLAVYSLPTRRYVMNGVRSHAPSIRSHRGTKVVWQDFQPMRVRRRTGLHSSISAKSSFYLPAFEISYRLGRSQMQGGKNWILPKEINPNRFFWESHWLEIAMENPLMSLYGTEWTERAMDSAHVPFQLNRAECEKPVFCHMVLILRIVWFRLHRPGHKTGFWARSVYSVYAQYRM